MPVISAPGQPDINQPATGKSVRGVRNVAANAAAYLPYLLQALFAGGGAGANSLTQANLEQLLKFGPQFASAEAAAQKAGKESEVATDAGLLAGGGKDVTQRTLDLQKLVDPEFFGLRESIAGKGQELLAGQDPNKLSEAERAEVERNANRSNIGSGVAGSGSQTAAIGNALSFGDRLQSKRTKLLETLTNLGGLAPGLRSGAFNYGAATGAGGAGLGINNLQGTFNTAQQQTGQLANNLLGQAGAVQQQRVDINANKVAPWEKFGATIPDY